MKAQCGQGRAQQGFTLYEVLIAVLIVATGLFGFGKMQALAVSSTQVSGSRALVAMQASSLAAAMRGGRAYWASGLAPGAFSAQGNTVTDATGVLNVAPSAQCTASTVPATPLCSPAQLAARDLQAWAANMASRFPTYQATGNCSTTAVTTAPVRCTITIVWTEKYTQAGRNTVSDSAATGGQRAYTLYVEP